MLDVVVAGLVAEWTRKVLVAPLDTLTVRLQVERASGRKRVRNPLAEDAYAVVRQLRQPAGLYQGLGVGLVGAIPTALVYMPCYELCATLLRWSGIPAQLAAVCTGIMCSVVRVPTAVVKSRLQCGAGSARQAVSEALAVGWIGLYASWRATCVLDVTYAVVQFSALEQLRAFSTLEDRLTLIGLLTGVVTAVVTEPLDVVATRLRVQRRGGHAYTGLVDGLRSIARDEGVLALWRGLLPRLVLKAVGSLIWYPVYVQVRRAVASALGGSAVWEV